MIALCADAVADTAGDSEATFFARDSLDGRVGSAGNGEAGARYPDSEKRLRE